MNAKQEESCIDLFLDYLNDLNHTDYKAQRTEKHFTELKDRTRWDFVAFQSDNPEKWLAIELKEIPMLIELDIRFKHWQKICVDITNQLEDTCHGVFRFYLPPPLDLAHREAPRLRKALVNVLSNKAEILQESQWRDIGPDVAQLFTEWPKQESNTQEYDTWGKYRPHVLSVTKKSAYHCEVKPYSSPLLGGETAQIISKNLDNIIHRGCTANEQLRLAKSYGASVTILLLCYTFIENEIVVEAINEYLKNMAHGVIPGIDFIYLLYTAEQKEVTGPLHPNR